MWFDEETIKYLIESRAFDSVDEYGVECKFKPNYKYSQSEFYRYDDGSGFRLEYDLTANSQLIYLSLQLEFIYTKCGIKSRFLTIDPQ